MIIHGQYYGAYKDFIFSILSKYFIKLLFISFFVFVRSEQDKEPEQEVASQVAGPGPTDDSAGDGVFLFCS